MHEQLIKVKLSTDVANLVNYVKQKESRKNLLKLSDSCSGEQLDNTLKI